MTNDVIMALVVGYLLGSIPFGLLLTRAAGLGDIRGIGSGNIGATNVLRTGNRWLAAGTLVLDCAKAAAAVLIIRYFVPEPPLAYSLAGMAAFAGHIFPVWLGFKGGKGVATYIGALLAINWQVGLIFCAVWLFIAATRRISSLAALTAAATAPIFAYVLSGPHLAAGTGAMTLLLFFTHRANIARLLSDTEPKIGADKTAQ
ncbi:glycerol-3-phosphate 1-O-acyltransferase PlsY [Mariluticola halotolerans]|uniref:glycerol-3-phosphate 1-O-acyltransferase PlsY n=1 Tax=Mariluticola halotolerans TaxID=2909283 RepID=UPI0026E1741C|nr:glycerol-3-phosphate 1-O-acyltransferase PlsY [Mariluticola halotolerans]UJQ95219.1 glycerol-3-phosphate 1-O-acyltransferase PlsY [Mariluticola halotolerans]